MARTETPLFRKALALVALWCLLWAVIGFLNHNKVPTYDQRAGYRESMEGCAEARLEAARDGTLTALYPGRREMAACTDRIRRQYRGAEAAEQRQITIATLIWALLPALLLLLLAAFAEEVRRFLPPRRPG